MRHVSRAPNAQKGAAFHRGNCNVEREAEKVTILQFIAWTLCIAFIFACCIAVGAVTGREFFGVNDLERRVEALERQQSAH